MKIAAIRAQIGSWIYYVSTLSFSQVDKYVSRIDDELHKSKLLRDMLQRSITDNYKSIATYIETQKDRFFNALILAVYDGDPQWHEVRLETEDADEYIGLGVLEFSGGEKIFPIDGQHRVEGIKKVMSDSSEYKDEAIPVVFIGHRKDSDGMQRARRLFSTLNRYAKPVSMRDIIALDEDDIIAIASRELIDSHRLFADDRILDSKTKAIPESNNAAFTTIITFYECNKMLLDLFLKNKEVKNSDGKKLRGGSKTSTYIRFRPSDEEIISFIDLCNEYWDGLSDSFSDLKEYLDGPANTEILRNRDGGNLLFRPAALLPFTKAAARIKAYSGQSFSYVFESFPPSLLKLNQKIWHRVLWNPYKKSMIMNNQSLTEIILLYYWCRDVLSQKEINRMLEDLQFLNQLQSPGDVDQIVESVAENNE